MCLGWPDWLRFSRNEGVRGGVSSGSDVATGLSSLKTIQMRGREWLGGGEKAAPLFNLVGKKMIQRCKNRERYEKDLNDKRD